MLKKMTGTDAVHVPYRGAAPALNDLLAGQLDFLFDPGIAIEHVKAGKLRAIAIGSPQRSPQLPDVPTLQELGLAGFDADAVFGVYAPAGTSGDIVTRLNTEINRALATAALTDRITAVGNIPAAMSPAEFGEKSRKDFRPVRRDHPRTGNHRRQQLTTGPAEIIALPSVSTGLLRDPLGAPAHHRALLTAAWTRKEFDQGYLPIDLHHCAYVAK